MVFFSVENPAGFSIKSKATFSYKKPPMHGIFLVLKNLPVFRSYRDRFHLNLNFYSKFPNVNEQQKKTAGFDGFCNTKKKVARVSKFEITKSGVKNL